MAKNPRPEKPVGQEPGEMIIPSDPRGRASDRGADRGRQDLGEDRGDFDEDLDEGQGDDEGEPEGVGASSSATSAEARARPSPADSSTRPTAPSSLAQPSPAKTGTAEMQSLQELFDAQHKELLRARHELLLIHQALKAQGYLAKVRDWVDPRLERFGPDRPKGK